MRELRSNKRKGAKVSISSVVTEMTQFSEEVFLLVQLMLMLLLLTHFVQLMLQHVAVIDTLWSGVHHVANYVGGVISSDDVELFFVSSSIKHQMGSNNGQNGHHGTGIKIRNQLFFKFYRFSALYL